MFLETCGGAIRGEGKALPAMLVIRVNMRCVHIGALKLIMAKSPVVGSVAWVYPITWICTSLCLITKKTTAGCRERREASWGDTRSGA